MGEIHDVTINSDDEILILHQIYVFKRRKIRKYSYLLKQFEASSASMQFKRNKTSIYNEWPNRKGDRSCQVIIGDRAAYINFNAIYLGIANMDFNRRPFIEGEVYVLNLTKQTVTLMYDGRGCDLISPNAELLGKYYKKLTNLILELNRPEITQRLQVGS